MTCDLKYDCSNPQKDRVDLNDDSHFSREVFLLDDILPNYVFTPRKAPIESSSIVSKFQLCMNLVSQGSNSTEDFEKCKQLPIAKKPTNVEEKEKIAKNITSKSEEIPLFQDEEDQDFGIKGFEIKDGIIDDFKNSTTPNPLYNDNRMNANRITSDEKTTTESSFAPSTGSSGESKVKFVKVPGDLHTLLIDGLESEEHYLVSIRACVKDTISKTPCGPSLEMHASPINLSTAKFFEKYNISIV